MTREQFLEYFRSDKFQEEMSADDCLEIFMGSLKGSSDITKENIKELASTYNVDIEKVMKKDSTELTDALMEIEMDEYDEVVNCLETYMGVASLIKQQGACLIGWTDGLGTHYDILFSLPRCRQGMVQGGLKWDDLFVSIMRIGAFGFDVENENTHFGYYAEKLGIGSRNETAEKVGEFINGVKKELNSLRKKE